MTGVKIGPPGSPPAPPEQKPEAQDRSASDAAGTRFADALSTPEAAGGSADIAEVVTQLREGRIGVDEALDRLVGSALDERLVASAPEARKEEIRRALGDLAREDPTLAALVRAMER